MAPPLSSRTAYTGLTYATSIWPGSTEFNNMTFPHNLISTTIQQTIDSAAPPKFADPIRHTRSIWTSNTTLPSPSNISYIAPKLPPFPTSRLEQTQNLAQPPQYFPKVDTVGLIVGGITIVLVCIVLFGVWLWSCRKLYKYLGSTEDIEWDSRWPMREYRPDQTLAKDCMKNYIIAALAFILSVTMPVWGPIYWCVAQLQKRKQGRADKNGGNTNDVEEDGGGYFEYVKPFKSKYSSSLYGGFARVAGLSKSEQAMFTRGTRMMTFRERCRLESEMRRINKSHDLDEETTLGDDFMRVRIPIIAHTDVGDEEKEHDEEEPVSWSPIDYGERVITAKKEVEAIVPITLATIDRLTGTDAARKDNGDFSVQADFTNFFRLDPGQDHPNTFNGGWSGSSGWSDCVSPRSSYEKPGLDHFVVSEDRNEDEEEEIERK